MGVMPDSRRFLANARGVGKNRGETTDSTIASRAAIHMGWNGEGGAGGLEKEVQSDVVQRPWPCPAKEQLAGEIYLFAEAQVAILLYGKSCVQNLQYLIPPAAAEGHD